MAVHIESSLCRGCGICAERCPEEAISMCDVAVVNNEKCSECGICIEICPVDAIKMNIHIKEKDISSHSRSMISFRQRGFKERFVQGRGRTVRSGRERRYPVQKDEREEVINTGRINHLCDQARSLQEQLQDIRKRIEALRSNAYK
jgi:Pyruvate/2-oxoacid:ferredoxin oxidoreductase delta subunit